MRIAVIRRRRWPEAIRAAGHTCIELPELPNAPSFDATLEDRIAHGRRIVDILRDEPVDLILATNGDGLLFADDPQRVGTDALVHHVLGVPLVSHWTETLRILFKQVDPALWYEALRSPTWYKGIFTRIHLAEMEWMGIPGCFYLPLAADEIACSTDRPVIDEAGPKVLFAGNVQSRYFSHGDGVDVRTQWPGAMALAAASDGSASSFLEAYRRYAFGPQPALRESAIGAGQAVQRYYARKMFFIASRNVATRDRFVYFLQKHLGSDFLLVGHDRWHQAYGLASKPPVDDATYRELIRRTPICINMVNGDNDSGLNLRHFEVTVLGGFLLSYRHPELHHFFEIGTECEAFSNERELLDKIDYYLEHLAERDAIAQAGQRRTLSDHLLRHRLATMLSHVKEVAAHELGTSVLTGAAG